MKNQKPTIIYILLGCLFVYFSSCKKVKVKSHYDKQWKTYTVDSGQHYANPLFFRLYSGNRRDTGCIKLSESMYYDLKGYDQWNKVRGFKFDPRQDQNGYPRKTSIVSWRCMKDTNGYYFEFAPYFNRDSIIFPDSTNILRADSGVIHWIIEYNRPNTRVSIWNDKDTVLKTLKIGNFNTYTSIGFYFGGAKTAPNNIQTEIK